MIPGIRPRNFQAVFGQASSSRQAPINSQTSPPACHASPFPGVGIKRVIDDPLGSIKLMVVLEAEMPKAFGDA